MMLYVLEFNNGKFYVGITSRSFNERFAEHLYLSQNPTTKIQYALSKYYPEQVKIHTTDGYADWETLCRYEIEEIARYNSFRSGYNMTLGGDGVLGNKAPKSEETKLRMSEAKKGKSAHNKGKPMSEETKRKMSLAHQGKPSPKKGKTYE